MYLKKASALVPHLITTMFRRLSIKSKPKPKPSSPLQSNETSPTRSSSVAPSPPVNLADEYARALRTNSYNEIWYKIHIGNPDNHLTTRTTDFSGNLVSQVLRPNREQFDQVLHRAKPTRSTRLVSAYLNHSEETSQNLCLLQYGIAQARSLYEHVHDLLDVLPADSLSQSQCNQAFAVFLHFSHLDNPFPKSILETFRKTCLCFSELDQQLNSRLGKVQKQTRFPCQFIRNPAFCLRKIASKKKVMHDKAQLEAASKGAYVLKNDLDTIDLLVKGLHNVVESDKVLVGIGLARERDRYIIQHVVELLRKKHPKFMNQLRGLEEHVCLCLATVKRARSLLLQEIHLHQDNNTMEGTKSSQKTEKMKDS